MLLLNPKSAQYKWLTEAIHPSILHPNCGVQLVFPSHNESHMVYSIVGLYSTQSNIRILSQLTRTLVKDCAR